MARSLNRVQLLGNLTRDPELRYTPTGSAVCTFGLATNRSWITDAGEKREEVDFHKIVAWNKLGEICSQFLAKGRKVYVEGRLSTRNWTAQDGQQKTTTEIIIDDMILLDNKGNAAPQSEEHAASNAVDGEKEVEAASNAVDNKKSDATSNVAVEKKVEKVKNPDEEVMPDDIPF
jgi:single-strand DNA-binding protein